MATKKELDKKVLARLAMSDDKTESDWVTEHERLEKRKKEAAQAMVSDEQKKLKEEQEKKQREKLASQKRLEDLRGKKKTEEEIKKKDISLSQKEEDAKAEKEKEAKIDEILKSQEKIQSLTKQKNNGLKSLKTLSSETIRAIKDEGLSSSKIAIASQGLAKKIPPKQPRSRGEILILITAAIFCLLSIGLVSYFIIRNKNSENQTIQTRSSLLFADQHLAIDLTDKDLSQINSSVATAIKNLDLVSPKDGTVADLYFTENVKYMSGDKTLTKQADVVASDFVASSTEGIPSEFNRFLSDQFMVGILQNGGSRPFFIFKTQDYANLMDTMLKNEGVIISNLYNLTSTSNVVGNIIGLPLKDKTVQNIDLRIAQKPDGTTVALYGFIDQNTVLVAEDETDFIKLLGLYKAQK